MATECTFMFYGRTFKSRQNVQYLSETMKMFALGNLSHITKHLSFAVCDKVKIKTACSAKEASFFDVSKIDVMLSRQRTENTLSDQTVRIRIRIFTGDTSK